LAYSHEPQTAKGVFCGYYKRFIQSYGTINKSLTNLLKKYCSYSRMQFNFDIEYKKGKENNVAHSLSRLPMGKVSAVHVNTTLV